MAELAHLFAGLVFPPNRQPSAEAGMRRAMSGMQIGSPAELLRTFETPGEGREAVLAELTVGESYFYRDSAQLQLLVTDILPPRRETYGPSRPLCIWSAGCASGEEPYTIALLMREQGWPHPSQIIATDIAQPRLAAARRGRYTRWALRGVSDERIGRWFSHNGNYYDLMPAVREMVEFRRLNLVVDEYPVASTGGFDLVLCRNVMIYFDMPTVAHIAAGLLASLAPDGWLLLGASDPPLAHLVPCQSIMTAAGVAYRRVDAATDVVGRSSRDVLRFDRVDAFDSTGELLHPNSRLVPAAWPTPATITPAEPTRDNGAVDSVAFAARPEAAPARPAKSEPVAPSAEHERATPLEALERAYQRADYGDAERIAMTLLASTAQSVPRAWIAYVRSVANQGRLHEAGELCARALDLHPLAAELHVLHATLLLEAGWLGDAASAARRSIYLDRTLVMGHMLLGDALTRSGDAAGARIAFTNVLGLLAKVDPSAPVTAADGVSATRLRQIAASRVRASGQGVGT
ncbi:MAG: hypothetical protein M3Z05_01290 [Gemmatimonadota bacterium]|nr:hypothetical protein [Gemmatimonadota bacterium]